MSYILKEEAKKILTDLAQEFSDDDKKVWILAEAHGKIDSLPSLNTTSDYISREEVLKILNGYIDEEYPDPTSGATLNMIDEIKALPSLSDNSQWIPVSERLPEEDHIYVLGANARTKFVGEMNWEKDYGFRHHMMPGQTITHWKYFDSPPLT